MAIAHPLHYVFHFNTKYCILHLSCRSRRVAWPRSRSSHGVIVEQRTRPARGLKAAGARPGGARRRPHLAGLPCTCNTMRTSAVWPDAAGSHQDTPMNTTRRTLGLCKVNGKVTKNEEAWSHKEHQGTKEELEEQLWGLHHRASVAQS